MSHATITTRKPQREVHGVTRREEPAAKKNKGEEVLDRCDLGDLQEIEFMRRVLRAGRPGASEEALDRCGSKPQEIEFMRRVLQA